MAADPYIGNISSMGFTYNPRGWAFCAGALLPISQNSTLFSLLGTIYGGDGRTTLALPDLRGRGPMGYGRHPGSLYDWRIGQRAGSETHTLTASELTTHSHVATFTPTSAGTLDISLEATTTEGDSATPTDGCYLAKVKEVGAGGADYIYSSTPGTKVKLGGLTASGTGGTGTVTVSNSGASNDFSIMQPVLAINFCIAMVGTYPPRN